MNYFHLDTNNYINFGIRNTKKIYKENSCREKLIMTAKHLLVIHTVNELLVMD